ncbi:MAG: PQQ-binding-like beta-propeller repeat protein, partial [Verrucomicrobia bacterium]|nr:PQQ-binding-like beta-propeller repeat protein [Verrucomicrobiota bacterium]
ETHVAWQVPRVCPYVPSPLCYGDNIYLLGGGGVVSCIAAATGKLLWKERLGATGDYYASPIAGDGKMYLVSEGGDVTVVAVGEEPRVLAQSSLGERCLATPAIVSGRLYLRSENALYSFGNAHQPGTIAPSRLDSDELEKARRLFPPAVTRELLTGKLAPPPGFDGAFAERLGQKRLDALRTGADQVSGHDNDIAASCLVRLGVAADNLKPAGGKLGSPAPGARARSPEPPAARVTATFIRSEYPVANGKTSGFFKTGQDADILLSGIDFNQTGGPLLFNHPMGIGSDGNRLILADTYNNRVLIWNKLPQGNVPPDLVLGQKNFNSNNPGRGRDQLNWPVNVATDGKRIVVADTENHRILVWNQFPRENGVSADLILQGGKPGEGIETTTKSNFHWPWGVWTDGEKLAITSTRGGRVLIWNRFPTEDNQPADLFLSGGGKLGTPRTITSDGKHLIVGDHNPRMGQPWAGTFFWKTFPTTDDAPFDFYRTEPGQPGGPWLRGCFTRDLPAARQAGGKLLLLGSTLHLWKAFPVDATEEPDLSIRGYNFHGGDHTGVATAGERIYIVTGNANKVVVYNATPTKPNSLPDFAIGSPDIDANTLETNFIISNPVPASNGKSLFVASDFDRKLYVWKKLPDKSGAHPDLVYEIDCPALDIALWRDTLILAGMQTVYVWKRLPLEGNPPDLIFDGRIGSVRFQELRGVALDDRYFYLSDFKAGKIYVWEGIPSANSEPALSLNVEKAWRISSDGNYLAVATFDRHLALIYRVAGLAADARPVVVGERSSGAPPRGRPWFNGVSKAMASQGHFFVAEGFNRVHAWSKIEDAIVGQRADVILGQDNFEEIQPQIGRNKLHYPAAVWFDGSYLWVGETKFSERLLRFSPRPDR